MKTNPARPAQGPAVSSGSASVPSVAAVVSAWNGAYGGTHHTGDWTSSPIGMLPASAANRVAASLPSSGLPQTVSMVFEVEIPTKSGELPRLNVLVPDALQAALKNVSKKAGTDDYPNAPAGLGMLLGACGAVRMKVLKPVAPPQDEITQAAVRDSMKLENAVSSALGLFRLLEGCQSDVEYALDKNSPVWPLLSSVAASLKDAFENAPAAFPALESNPGLLALEVMEAGGRPQG